MTVSQRKKCKLVDTFVQCKQMMCIELLSFLSIPDILKLLLTCKEIYAIIEVNRLSGSFGSCSNNKKERK